jgi:hypothetical protein
MTLIGMDLAGLPAAGLRTNSHTVNGETQLADVHRSLKFEKQDLRRRNDKIPDCGIAGTHYLLPRYDHREGSDTVPLPQTEPRIISVGFVVPLVNGVKIGRLQRPPIG